MTRTTRKDVVFTRPFLLKAIGRVLSPGSFEVLTDEELIEGLSFPVYRRIATMILVPGQSHASSIEMVTVDPGDLQSAQDLDRDTSSTRGLNNPAESKSSGTMKSGPA